MARPRPHLRRTELVRLSIIISTWNSLRYLRECLESISALTLQDFETIVVDSNSKDGTIEYVKQMAERNGKLGLRLITSSSRLMWSSANQIGLDISRGDWICLSNPDIHFNECFVKMLEYCHASGASVVAPQLIHPDGRPQGPYPLTSPLVFLLRTHTAEFLAWKLFGKRPVYRLHYRWNGEQTLTIEHPVGSFFLVSRRTLLELGGRLWHPGYRIGVSDSDAFMNFKRRHIRIDLFPSCQIVHYEGHRTLKDRTWVEYDTSYGIVLYFRYWRMRPALMTVVLAVEGFTSAAIDLLVKIVSPKSSVNARTRAWRAGQRWIGLVDGWRFKIRVERIP